MRNRKFLMVKKRISLGYPLVCPVAPGDGTGDVSTGV